MIGAPVPGVVNALQVTIPGRSPSVPSVKALGNARDEKKPRKKQLTNEAEFQLVTHLLLLYLWVKLRFFYHSFDLTFPNLTKPNLPIQA